MKVCGQVVFAEGVPDQALCSLWCSDEDRGCPERQCPVAEPNDEVHGLVCKKLSCFFSNLLLNHGLLGVKDSRVRGFKFYRISLEPLNPGPHEPYFLTKFFSGPNFFTSSVTSWMTCENFTPSAAETQENWTRFFSTPRYSRNCFRVADFLLPT